MDGEAAHGIWRGHRWPDPPKSPCDCRRGRTLDGGGHGLRWRWGRGRRQGAAALTVYYWLPPPPPPTTTEEQGRPKGMHTVTAPVAGRPQRRTLHSTAGSLSAGSRARHETDGLDARHDPHGCSGKGGPLTQLRRRRTRPTTPRGVDLPPSRPPKAPCVLLCATYTSRAKGPRQGRQQRRSRQQVQVAGRCRAPAEVVHRGLPVGSFTDLPMALPGCQAHQRCRGLAAAGPAAGMACPSLAR